MKLTPTKHAMMSNSGNINVARTENTSIGIRADAENRSTRYRTKIDVAVTKHTREISLWVCMSGNSIDQNKKLLMIRPSIGR